MSLRDEAILYLSRILCVDVADIVTSLEYLESDGFGETAYIKFYRPKKSGGRREIRAPKQPLKMILTKIYLELLVPHPLNYHIHGFRPRRSIVTNAKTHLDAGAKYVLNMDIENCFPSTPITLVEMVFNQIFAEPLLQEGVEREIVEEMVEILTSLTTLQYGRAKEKVLPVGAPTSPSLLNHVLQPFDYDFARNLKKVSERHGTVFTFTRYGDDITVSSPNPIPRSVFGIASSIVNKYGYKLNPHKTRLMVRGSSTKPPEITGIILGQDRLLLPDKLLKKFELTLISILRFPIVEGKGRMIMLGILGICRMVYDGVLPERIANGVIVMLRWRELYDMPPMNWLLQYIAGTSGSENEEDLPDVFNGLPADPDNPDPPDEICYSSVADIEEACEEQLDQPNQIRRGQLDLFALE